MKSIAVEHRHNEQRRPLHRQRLGRLGLRRSLEQGGFDPWTSYQINLYRIETGETFQLTNDIAGNFNPSIEGTTVAWETKLPNAI